MKQRIQLFKTESQPGRGSRETKVSERPFRGQTSKLTAEKVACVDEEDGRESESPRRFFFCFEDIKKPALVAR